MMKRIDFKNKSAQKLYDNYLDRIVKYSSVLSKEDANDLLMEFNSHIYEGLQNMETDDEVAKVISVLDRLGDPAETLKPLIAGKKLKQATRTFNPKHVFQAIALNVKNSIFFGIFGLLYLLLFTFLLLIPAKLIFPKNTGMFFLNGELKSFGFDSSALELTEVLGYWIIPLVLAVVSVIYLLITLLMRFWGRN